VIKAAYPRSLSLSLSLSLPLSFTCTAFSFSIFAYTYTATRRWARVADTGSFKAIGRIFQGEAALLGNSVRSRLEDLGFASPRLNATTRFTRLFASLASLV